MNDLNLREELETLLKPYGISFIMYFDRIHLYVDARLRTDEIETIRSWNENNDRYNLELLPNSHLNRKLELYQIDPTQLDYLQETVGDHAITWIECAYDFMTPSKSDCKKLAAMFNRHLVYNNGDSQTPSYNYNTIKTTTYLSRPESNLQLAMYDDKPARMIVGKKLHCVHLEYRVKKLDNVKQFGVITLTNLINFDHPALWNDLFDLRYCNKTHLGELITEIDQPPDRFSRKTYNKYGCQEWGEIDSLQEYLADNPGFAPAFKPVESLQALKNMVNEYF